jgi:hypothetical protein
MRSILFAVLLSTVAAAVVGARMGQVDPPSRDRTTLQQSPSCPAVSVPTTGDRRDAQELARIAQRLLDAVATGDTATWAAYLDTDGIFTDEDGNMRDRPRVLAELRPLPPAITGQICVSDPRASVHGDVAVLSYDAMETASLYGQVLHTHYHTSDTYTRRGGHWFLLASQTAVMPSEHTAVPVSAAVLDDFVGKYVLSPGVEYLVQRDGAHLYGQRAGGQREELLPLGADRFFRTGAPRGERIFRRDVAGRVDAMLDRRDNNDLVWRRE